MSAFDEYTQRVRRWIPRLTAAYPGRLRDSFDVRRALKKEHNPFAAWATGALALLGWELYARGELTDAALGVFLGAETAVLLAFVVIKAYKRGLLFASPR